MYELRSENMFSPVNHRSHLLLNILEQLYALFDVTLPVSIFYSGQYSIGVRPDLSHS
ncbi:MAG: hypothetical protein ACI8RD_012878 [Bacillariaceae sp.]|jgi:hypothetical protein